MAVHLLLGLLILSMAGYSSANFCVCKPGVSPDKMQQAIDYACGAGADCGPINPDGKCYNPNSMTAHCSFAVNSYYQKNAAKGATCDFQGVATQTNSDPSGGGCSYSASSGGSTSSGTGSPSSPVSNVPTSSPTTPTTPVTPVSGSGGTPMSGSGGTPGVTPVSGSGGTPTSGSGGTPTSGSGSTGSGSTGTGSTGTGSTGTGSTGTGGMGSGTGGMGTNPTTASPYTASPNAGNGVFGGVGTGLAPTGSYDDSHVGITLQSMTLGSSVMILAMSTIMLVWN